MAKEITSTLQGVIKDLENSGGPEGLNVHQEIALGKLRAALIILENEPKPKIKPIAKVQG